jgi:hypothetical protein
MFITCAVQDGNLFTDKYLLELDFVEVVEKRKEGYEPDVVMDEDLSDGPEEDVQPGQRGGGASRSQRKRGKFLVSDYLSHPVVLDSNMMGNIGRYFNVSSLLRVAGFFAYPPVVSSNFLYIRSVPHSKI